MTQRYRVLVNGETLDFNGQPITLEVVPEEPLYEKAEEARLSLRVMQQAESLELRRREIERLEHELFDREGKLDAYALREQELTADVDRLRVERDELRERLIQANKLVDFL